MISACEANTRHEQSLQTELDVMVDQLTGLSAGPQEFTEAYFDLYTKIWRINLAYNCLEQKLIDLVRVEPTRLVLE